jgi:VWFA-related protein
MTTIANFSQHAHAIFEGFQPALSERSESKGGSFFALRFSMLRRSAGLVGFLCLSVAGLTALQNSPFKAGNRTVAVYATVTDPGGRLILDLTQDDFAVDDNGKRQDLTVFANDIQPITVVVLLDRSGSMEDNFDLVRDAAKEFVRQLLPADKVRVGSFAQRIQLDPRDFTSDKTELLDILDTELQDAGPTPLWNAVNVGITALVHQEGRRVILVFTDGADEPDNLRTNNSTLGEVMKRADAENVMVYSIGLAGQPFPRSMRGGPGGSGGPGRYGGRGGRGGFGGSGGGRLAGRLSKPDPGLATLAAATGGGYFELTSTRDLVSTFKRVADELHHQYVLGFTPPLLDGKTHKLTVSLRDSTLAVRARKSYLASRES